MRVVLLLLCAWFAVSFAPTSEAQVRASDAPTATHVASARDLLQALTLDNGTMEIAVTEAVRMIAPRMQASLMQTDLYAGLTADHKRALDAAFERLPALLAAEAMRSAPSILDEYAPLFAAQMSEQDLTDAAIFLRTAEGRAWAVHELLRAASDTSPTVSRPAPLSDAEARASSLFNRSSAGRALNRPEITRLSHDLGERVSSSPNVAAALKGELCAALEEQCPPSWRP